MKSTTTNRFAQNASVKIPRSKFHRPGGNKSAFDAGYLIPVFCDEALPGDTFKMRADMFARMTTPVYPLMDNLFMDVHWFDCPLRLIWDNFPKFMGEQIDPGDSIDYTTPKISDGNIAEGSLSDYFGMPIVASGLGGTIMSLYHRAYGKIYNEWFRDQNLQDSVTVARDDGPDILGTDAPKFPLKRGKRHDYLTSSLPWPQKGDAVVMPLGDKAEIHTAANQAGNPGIYSDGAGDHRFLDTGSTWATVSASGGTTAQDNVMYADLSTATAATISAMRTSVALQQMLERDARGGTRYKEVIKSHFGVDSPDARLQRPEFLGGGTFAVNVTPIAQTSQTDAAVSPQGNLAAFATVSGGTGFTKSFTEHSIVMGIVSIRADLTYQQGLNRKFSRSTRYDYFWPGLQNISEQEVLNKEIYLTGTSTDDDAWGYQERYSEYKYMPSICTGKMRSAATGTLDAWHLAQNFASLPVLGDTFIQEAPPMDRILAVADEPDFIFDSYFDLTCVRPMALFSQPGLTRF